MCIVSASELRELMLQMESERRIMVVVVVVLCCERACSGDDAGVAVVDGEIAEITPVAAESGW
jgi:hypothetical protein